MRNPRTPRKPRGQEIYLKMGLKKCRSWNANKKILPKPWIGDCQIWRFPAGEFSRGGIPWSTKKISKFQIFQREDRCFLTGPESPRKRRHSQWGVASGIGGALSGSGCPFSGIPAGGGGGVHLKWVPPTTGPPDPAPKPRNPPSSARPGEGDSNGAGTGGTHPKLAGHPGSADFCADMGGREPPSQVMSTDLSCNGSDSQRTEIFVNFGGEENPKATPPAKHGHPSLQRKAWGSPPP